ncbi:MAG TPA: MFS transporter [Roseiflexaceae bacterium]|nr:MFS transporter [Roseiflexaceae bacterium]
MNQSTTERNLRLLIIELFWAAIAVGCYSFAAAFLIRLGGSNLMVSLLTSAAALVNALTSIPFAMFLERKTRRWPWVVGSLYAFRLGHMALIFIPFLPAYRPEAMVLLLLLVNVPVALFNAGWLPMFADVVPLHRRARLFSARNMTLGVTMMITTFLMGRWLDAAPFPFNYQLMFALALVTSLLSTVYVQRMVVPDSTPPPQEQATRQFSLADVRALLTQQRPFVNITVNTLVFNIALWMGTPLQPIYFVRELGASDGWMGIWLALMSGGALIGNLIWPRLIDRCGFGWVLLRATALSALYYFLIGLVPNLTLILVFAVMFGAIQPGVDVSHFNILLEICPPARRALYLSIFVTIMNMGFFLATLACAPLIDLLGAQTLVLVLAGLRLFGALLFRLNPVRAPVTEAAAAP